MLVANAYNVPVPTPEVELAVEEQASNESMEPENNAADTTHTEETDLSVAGELLTN